MCLVTPCVAHTVHIKCDAMCGTYCACLVWHVWHILCMFSVTCVAHTQFLLPAPSSSPMFHDTLHLQQQFVLTVSNLFLTSALSVIELFQLCCKVSAKDLPGTLQWSLLVFYVIVFSTASCTMQGNCFCFVDFYLLILLEQWNYWWHLNSFSNVAVVTY